MRSLFVRLYVVVFLVVLAGCSRDARKPVHPVHGQVLFDRQPAAGAIVTFHPVNAEAGEPTPSARTDDQGRFVLTSYRNGDGAAEGEYRVTVTWFRSYRTGPSEEDTTTGNFLAPRYANPESSQLRVTIRAGDNTLPPFQLLP